MKKPTIKFQKFDFSSIPIFGVTLAYGVGLVMIGYTFSEIGKITGLPPSAGPLLVVPQSLSLYLGTLILPRLMGKFSAKTIFVSGLLIALMSTILLSQLDHITTQSLNSGINASSLTAYCILNFSFGAGLSIVLPLTNTYFTASYTNQKQSLKMISINNGVFCIGAAALPLFAGKAVIDASKADYFDAVRYFYYIAMGFIVMGLFSSLFIHYKESRQNLKADDDPVAINSQLNQNTTQNLNSQQLPKRFIGNIIAISFGFLFLGILVETVFYYSFIYFFDTNNRNSLIIATQAFGLFFLVQGLVRFVMGIWLAPYLSSWWILILSIITIIIPSILITTGTTRSNINYTYLTAILAGIGFGNLLTILLIYSLQSYPPKKTLLSLWANSAANFPVAITQIILWQLLLIPNSLLAIGLMSIIGCLGTLLLVWWLFIYVRRSGVKNQSTKKQPPQELLSNSDSVNDQML